MAAETIRLLESLGYVFELNDDGEWTVDVPERIDGISLSLKSEEQDVADDLVRLIWDKYHKGKERWEPTICEQLDSNLEQQKLSKASQLRGGPMDGVAIDVSRREKRFHFKVADALWAVYFRRSGQAGAKFIGYANSEVKAKADILFQRNDGGRCVADVRRRGGAEG